VGKKLAVVMTANSLTNAINKALMKFPNKFITTTYARNVERYLSPLNEKERVIVTRGKNGFQSASLVTEEDLFEQFAPVVKTKLKHKLFMDLVNARKEAAKKSAKGKTVYVNVTEDGECTVEEKQDATTFATFTNGKEVPVETKIKLEKTAKVSADDDTKINKSKMETEKKSPVKKVATKAAKKTTPAKKVAAKKEAPAKEAKKIEVPKGKKAVTIKEIIALIKKGTKVYNHADKSLTLGYMEKMKDHSRSMPVSY
jgi:hypothetical protein